MARWFVDRSAQRGIPSVSLRRLLPDARFVGCDDLLACGCTSDVRRLEPGQVYVARPDGDRIDLARALEKGAAAVVLDRPSDEAGRPQVIVSDTRHALGRICQALAGSPAESMSLIGVTGTSGKSAVSRYLRAIEEAAGERCGVIGSDGWADGVTAYPPGASAPGPETFAEMLAAMAERGCRSGVISAPADDWESRRLDGVSLDAAVIANGQAADHSETQARRAGHARPFGRLSPGGLAIVNADDSEADLMGGVNLSSRRIAFSLGGNDADISGSIRRLDTSGTRLLLRGFGPEIEVSLRPIGRANATAALAAATAAWGLGRNLDDIVSGLESVDRLPGRLDRVASEQRWDVFIDRARSAEALGRALAALRETCRGKVHCLVGASGDSARDTEMAGVAEHGADSVVITVDRPLIDEPDRVLDGMLAGFRRAGRVRVEPDRRLAIEAVLAVARPGDAVLLAGDSASVDMTSGRSAPLTDRSFAILCLDRMGRGTARLSA